MREDNGLQPGSVLGITDVRIREDKPGFKNLRVAVKSRQGSEISPIDVKIFVYFYEKTADGEIVLTERAPGDPVDRHGRGLEDGRAGTPRCRVHDAGDRSRVLRLRASPFTTTRSCRIRRRIRACLRRSSRFRCLAVRAGSAMKILIVDGELGVAASLAQALGALGWELPAVATTSDEAIDWVNQSGSSRCARHQRRPRAGGWARRSPRLSRIFSRAEVSFSRWRVRHAKARFR